METIEFHNTPDGNVYYRVDGGVEKRLTKFSIEVFPILEIVKDRYPEAYERLGSIYNLKKSSSSDINDRSFRMLERFIRCNFGEYDLLTEDTDGKFLNFEEVKCPLRGGFCQDENVICKPKCLVKLSQQESKAAKLYLQGYTCQEIAERLGKHASTVKVLLFRVKNKLGVKNAREIIKVLRFYNF